MKNPYRYRGYRYDTETGLYYLQSRYYNPDWGRFVNADALGGVVGELLSHNVFAYCNNNSSNRVDSDGHYSYAISDKSYVTSLISFLASMGLLNPGALLLIGAVVVGVGVLALIKAVNSTAGKTKANSTTLGRNMNNNGKKKPNGPGKYHAHHIVPGGMYGYDKLRTIIEKAGIGINSASNGVWLEAKYHWAVHTTEYLNLLKSKINDKMSPSEIVKALNQVGRLLQGGWKPK